MKMCRSKSVNVFSQTDSDRKNDSVLSKSWSLPMLCTSTLLTNNIFLIHSLSASTFPRSSVDSDTRFDKEFEKS